jgi:hypothetical protein
VNLYHQIQSILAASPQLVRPRFRGTHPLSGHCYHGSEALYHLLGGKAAGLTAMFVKHEGQPHWFLKKNHEVIDLTAEQFQSLPPYHLARPIGFLTKQPSKRAKLVMEQLNGL